MARTGDGALDVIGVGALNLDYIVDASAVAETSPRLDGFEWGTETAVDDTTVDAVLNRVDPAAVTATPGGSAFNTVYALAHLRRRLRLGYVGIAGRTPTPGNSPIQQMELHGIDTAGVARTEDALCGVCVSLQQGRDRTLLTHAGANALMADVIEDHFDELLAYLSRGRIVHVTSFLDPATPAQLLRLLQELRRVNPQVLISFDPGHVWAAERSAETLGIVRLADVLMLNAREFQELARPEPLDSLHQNARKIMAGIDNPDAVLLLKQSHGVKAFRRQGTHVDYELHGARPVLRDHQIQDATGAGDVFAAGVLAALARSRRQVHLGVRLGLLLAGHKLRHVGAAGHKDFAELTLKVLPD
jgi:sugar/nucleoside kinase (ribokinase family)